MHAVENRILATVLFTDIVESTRRASQLGDRRWRDLLEAHDINVRRQVAARSGHVLKNLGDGYLATFARPAFALRCGSALIEDAASLGLQIRVGVHTGECELIGTDVAGIAVHIAARVLAKARPGEVLATAVLRDLVTGSGIAFNDRGSHVLSGVPGVWTLLAAEDGGTAAHANTVNSDAMTTLRTARSALGQAVAGLALRL